MKHKIAAILIMIMTVMMIFSSLAYATDNSVGIKIEFDKEAYVKGETATATLTLTGLTDAKNSGTKISAFETHLKFDHDKLTYSSEYSGFDTNLFDNTEDGTEKVFQVTQNYRDVIVIAFSYDSGISLDDKVNESGELKIGTVAFTINNNVSDKIEIGFNEVGFNGGSYVTELANQDIERIKINVPTVNSTAEIKNVIVENASATFTDNDKTVTGSIDIRLSKSQNAILIAQLYDTATGLTKETVVKQELNGVNKINDITFNNVSDKTNLVVKYYLWESFANMKALTTIQPTTIN